MTTVFPGAIDALVRPSDTTYTDDGGYELDVVLDHISDAIEAIEGVVIRQSSERLVINGNMDHFQSVGSSSRTSTTTYSTTTSYAADQMYVLPAGASVTQQRSTSVPDSKSRYSLEVTGASSVTTVDIGQRIEAAVVNTRALQSLIFSCYVYNDSGAAFTPNLRVGTPGSVDSFGTVTNRLDQALQSCANGAWTRVYHVFDPSAYTNIANGLDVALRVPSGSLVSGDVVRIAQFDLRPGTTTAAYVAPNPDEELLRALRFYQTLEAGSSNTVFAMGKATNTTSAEFGLLYAKMRTSPTVTISSYTDFEIDDSGPIACSSLSGDLIGPSTCRLLGGVASGLTAGHGVLIRAASTTSAKISLAARL